MFVGLLSSLIRHLIWFETLLFVWKIKDSDESLVLYVYKLFRTVVVVGTLRYYGKHVRCDTKSDNLSPGVDPEHTSAVRFTR